jgi:DNA helicase-2/ATP-dependent DNA helicase PcrA
VQPKPPEHPFSASAQRSLVAFYRMLASWMAAKDSLTVAALLDRIAEESGYATWLRDGTEEGEDRWSNLQELRSVAAHYDDFPPELRLTAFLEEVALVSDQDELAEEADRVTLLTLHTAKGLEFPVVFIVGLEENILPHSRSLEDPDQMEEERRLMYVGVTRAKDRLYLVRAFRRMIWGRSEVYEPSRFLRDVKAAGGGGTGAQVGGAAERHSSRGADERPSPFARRPGGEPAQPARSAPWSPGAVSRPPTGKPAKKGDHQLQFKPGDRVDHGLFGQGIVLKSEPTADDEEVTVSFAGKGTKTLLASFAKLRKMT